VTHHPVPIASRDRDADGEISETQIVTELRIVVAELAQRACASRAA